MAKFPTTRYQGSKRKLLPWIEDHLTPLTFDTMLDLFGGTGAVSYLCRGMGKTVHYNDYLTFNAYVGKALLLQEEELEASRLPSLFRKDPTRDYGDFIARTFSGWYYTDEENAELDVVVQNIALLPEEEKYGWWWVLFQACLSKRPYNLFHRKNLNLRLADVPRSFGNRTTWDTSFQTHMEKFRKQYNQSVQPVTQPHVVTALDAAKVDSGADLVYFDPPYLASKAALISYSRFYHFLEGMVSYDTWEERLEAESTLKHLKNVPSTWESKPSIPTEFRDLLFKHSSSQLVISYRVDGTPSIATLVEWLEEMGKTVAIHYHEYQYTLSSKKTSEVLLVGT
jgi:adenine-specific DNA-methyltransferase